MKVIFSLEHYVRSRNTIRVLRTSLLILTRRPKCTHCPPPSTHVSRPRLAQQGQSKHVDVLINHSRGLPGASYILPKIPPSSAFDSEAQALKGASLGIGTKGIASLTSVTITSSRQKNFQRSLFNVLCTLF